MTFAFRLSPNGEPCSGLSLGRSASDPRRQVSWLAGQCRSGPPSRDRPQWHPARWLAAYSCRDSRGLGATGTTAFPFKPSRAPARTKAESLQSGAYPRARGRTSPVAGWPCTKRFPIADANRRCDKAAYGGPAARSDGRGQYPRDRPWRGGNAL